MSDYMIGTFDALRWPGACKRGQKTFSCRCGGQDVFSSETLLEWPDQRHTVVFTIAHAVGYAAKWRSCHSQLFSGRLSPWLPNSVHPLSLSGVLIDESVFQLNNNIIWPRWFLVLSESTAFQRHRNPLKSVLWFHLGGVQNRSIHHNIMQKIEIKTWHNSS